MITVGFRLTLSHVPTMENRLKDGEYERTFYPFGKLRELFADIRKGSLFNGYYFHTFNFKRFIKRVDLTFIGK